MDTSRTNLPTAPQPTQLLPSPKPQTQRMLSTVQETGHTQVSPTLITTREASNIEFINCYLKGHALSAEDAMLCFSHHLIDNWTDHFGKLAEHNSHLTQQMFPPNPPRRLLPVSMGRTYEELSHAVGSEPAYSCLREAFHSQPLMDISGVKQFMESYRKTEKDMISDKPSLQESPCYDTLTKQLEGIKKYQAAIPKIQELLDKNSLTQGFNAENLWMLFIDFNECWMGPYCYEDEPGYLYGMMNGVNYFLNTIDRKITLDYLLELHKRATRGALDSNGKPIEQGARWGDIFDDVIQKRFCGTPRAYTSEKGLDEINSMIRMANDKYPCIPQNMRSLLSTPEINWIENQSIDGRVAFISRQVEEKKQFLADFLANYERNMRSMEDKSAIIAQIVDLCRTVDILHIAEDGNSRLAYLVLLKELLRHNLPPAIIESPLIFEGLSIEELSDKVRKGQVNFELCKKFPDTFFQAILRETGSRPLAWKAFDFR